MRLTPAVVAECCSGPHLNSAGDAHRCIWVRRIAARPAELSVRGRRSDRQSRSNRDRGALHGGGVLLRKRLAALALAVKRPHLVPALGALHWIHPFRTAAMRRLFLHFGPKSSQDGRVARKRLAAQALPVKRPHPIPALRALHRPHPLSTASVRRLFLNFASKPSQEGRPPQGQARRTSTPHCAGAHNPRVRGRVTSQPLHLSCIWIICIRTDPTRRDGWCQNSRPQCRRAAIESRSIPSPFRACRRPWRAIRATAGRIPGGGGEPSASFGGDAEAGPVGGSPPTPPACW